MKFLKPDIFKIMLLISILALPIFRENVPLENGSFTIERLSPILFYPIYIIQGEYFGLFMMICFATVVYLSISLLLAFLKKALAVLESLNIS